MSAKFVHLHVHTEYSLLDGLSNIKKLFKHIGENNMDAVAITDHGELYGAIEFYKEGIKQGIKPIIGLEGYVTTSLTEKVKDNYHLTLLAKNIAGYKNLMKLTSIAHIEGFYYRPRFTNEILKKYSEGLICLSGCPAAQIPQSLINENYLEASKLAEFYLDVFKDDFYMEIQRHNYESILPDIKIPELKSDLERVADNCKKYEDGVIKLSREFGIPLVATNDAHYIKKEDAPAQDALVCIATGKNVGDIKRLRYIDNPDFYLKTPDEMQKIFSDIPDAIENSVKIAQKCELEITLGKWFFPKFSLPKGKTPDEELRRLSHENLKIIIPKSGKEEEERLNYELDIICQKGYSPYFLIVMDLARWSNEQGIITNTRGSAAGSLVSFVLGITTINPLLYYLPFERFLNPYRPSPPDIDFDVADDRREEIIKYISDKYGHDKVAQICTFGRMLSRAAVRDVARVLGYPYATGDKVAKLIPPPKQGFPITVPKALEEVSELNDMYKSDADVKKILDLAIQLEGSARHLSVHAAGVVVAPTEITDYSPVQLEPSGDKIITQYEFHTCEDVGLIKFDILGIRNLSILGAAIKIVEERYGTKIKINDIPLDDKKTYEMLARGETMGTFQLGGSGMTKFLKELKPTRIEDLMAMVALYRPGPIQQIPEYIKRKHDPTLVKFLDKRMEKFLGASYGLLVYQDDLLFCALDLAGYSWEEADKFRKAVGKKIPEEMAAQKEKFIKGIVDNGQTGKFAEDLWKLFEPFQSYGFNKAHAASYGLVAYQTAYMKANYPVEYMCALLTAESNDTDKITEAINECRRMDVKVLSPDINKSSVGFDIEETVDSSHKKGIRFGLSAIKNVGNAAIDAILTERNKEKFKNFLDFLERVDGRRVNKKVLESLIKVGALSDFGKRSQLLKVVEEYKKYSGKALKNENQNELFSLSDLNSTSLNFDNLMGQDIDEFTDEEIQNLEEQLLGFSLSAKPIGEILKNINKLSNFKISDIFDNHITGSEGMEVNIAGIINDLRVIITKKSGQEMAFAKFQDETGTINVVIFPSIFSGTKEILTDSNPYLLSGKIDFRDEEPSLIVESIKNEKEIITEDNKLFIRIPKGTGTEKLSSLKELILKNPGDHKVCLVFEGEINKQLDLNVKINWDTQMAHSIEQILENLAN